ncbi:MAG TPA: hypothetical protein VNT58_04585 [Gaiellaceae bacterium]|nr:hypothetical protein [Gaiellaceae bacterium]
MSSFPEEWVNEQPGGDDEDAAGMEGVGQELGLDEEEELELDEDDEELA